MKSLPKLNLSCLKCSKALQKLPCQLTRGRGKFCSRRCSSLGNDSHLPMMKGLNELRASGLLVFRKRGGERQGECLVCSTPFKYFRSRGKPKYCSFSCSSKAKKGVSAHWLKGKPLSLEHRKKLSEAQLKAGNRPPVLRGPQIWNWKGGISPVNERIRKSAKYVDWRKRVFERDCYTCVVCKQVGRDIQADHIKPFAYFPELRFEVDNGRTMCKSCHKDTDTYGWKGYNKYEKYA